MSERVLLTLEAAAMGSPGLYAFCKMLHQSNSINNSLVLGLELFSCFLVVKSYVTLTEEYLSISLSNLAKQFRIFTDVSDTFDIPAER